MDKEKIKQDLISLCVTHPQFGEIVQNTLDYINKLEVKDKKINDFLNAKIVSDSNVENEIGNIMWREVVRQLNIYRNELLKYIEEE